MRDYNEFFLETVKQKLHEYIVPVNFLMDTLCIGKQAAYRRLRGEVDFYLSEAILIANKLGISLDLIMGISTEKTSFYRFCKAEFESPTERDYLILNEYLEMIKIAKDDVHSHMIISSNSFPQQIYMQFENLTRFFIFLWVYHEKSKQTKNYNQICISDRMKEVFKSSFEAHQQFKDIHFILDRNVELYLVKKIIYFYSIGMISKEEVLLIHNDIVSMLNYLEKIALTGKYENGSRVNLYVSNYSIDENCCNIRIKDFYISIIETYILNGIASTEKTDYDRMEEWILSCKRSSKLISICSEADRVEFFNELRSLSNELLMLIKN